jgi:hypothetical protein
MTLPLCFREIQAQFSGIRIEVEWSLFVLKAGQINDTINIRLERECISVI